MVRLLPTPHSDALRQQKKKDPQFLAFAGNSAQFFPWILECQVRKDNRYLPDDVDIQHAIIALGEHSIGLWPKVRTFLNRDDFVQHHRSF